MKIRILPALIIGAALLLTGCASTTTVSRNVGLDLPTVFDVPAQNWGFAGVEVVVPASLTVSEANTLKPRADIVWREDPLGDRHQQVDVVMTEALTPALQALNGETPVLITLTMTRFHALTERARYTLGGQHEVEFDMIVTHAETGAVLSGPRHVDLTFRALGGQEALAAEQQGHYQRDEIAARLAQWVAEEILPLSAPASTSPSS